MTADSQEPNPFLTGEGDRWYERNFAALPPEEYARMLESDHPLRIAKQFGLSPSKVLEVGCSDGWRLEEFRKRYGSVCTGIEPSGVAVDAGRKRYPEINLLVGAADALAVGSQEFDLVIMYAVFMYIPRDVLLKSCAELDRCIANDGFLIIDDFLPDHPMMTPYHHLPGSSTYCYKLDYAKIFTATNLYTLCGRVTYDHRVKETDDPKAVSFHRRSCSLLRKSSSEFFVVQQFQ